MQTIALSMLHYIDWLLSLFGIMGKC
ncbi:unnamed protein product, partial [Rotaria magnacalcarata]